MKTFELASLPELKSLRESPIELKGEVVGWHVTALMKNGQLGGGVNTDKNEARRVAIAEILERTTVRSIGKSNRKSDFLYDEFPTTCGFAAGFCETATRARAMCEGIERWAWSKWIDDGYQIPFVKISTSTLSKIAHSMLQPFGNVSFLIKEIDSSGIEGFPEKVFLGIVVGETSTGIYPGSRVATRVEDLWEHAAVEAYRHFRIAKDRELYDTDAFPFDRVTTFADSKAHALQQIERATKPTWPKPELRLAKLHNLDIGGVFVWRCLMRDFLGWEKGPRTRFVY